MMFLRQGSSADMPLGMVVQYGHCIKRFLLAFSDDNDSSSHTIYSFHDRILAESSQAEENMQWCRNPAAPLQILCVLTCCRCLEDISKLAISISCLNMIFLFPACSSCPSRGE